VEKREVDGEGHFYLLKKCKEKLLIFVVILKGTEGMFEGGL